MISANFLNSVILSLCYFLPIYFIKQLYFSVATSGMIISCYGIGTILGGVIGGKLSDKIAPSHICAISSATQGITFICMPFLTSPLACIINLLILGIATYAFITANSLATLATCKGNSMKRLKAINILEMIANLGLGIAALIIGLLSIQNMHYLFIGAGMVLFISPLISLIANHPQYKREMYVSSDAMNESLVDKINIQLIAYVLFGLFASGLMIAQLGSTYSIHLNNLFANKSASIFSLAFAMNTFLVVLLQTPIVSSIAKHNHVLIVGFGVFLLGLGLSFLAIATNLSWVLLSCLIYTMGEMLFFAVGQSICYENVPTHKKGLALGTYRMVFATSRVAGPAAGSIIYELYGSNYLWISCGVLGLIFLIIAIYCKDLLKK